jgi:hypothetical protein
MKHKKIWDDFCRKQEVIEQAVPLFDIDNTLTVRTHEIGQTKKRRVLSRSKTWSR